jgi:hypothetical protein
VAQRLRVLKILWLAPLLSLVAYAAVLFQLRAPWHPPALPSAPGLSPSALLGALALCAIAAAVASFVVPPVVLRMTLRKLGGSSRPEDSLGGVSGDASSRLSERDVKVYTTPFLLGIALSESVAVSGFALGFVGYRATLFAPFFVAGAVLMLVRYPSAARVAAALAAVR